MSEPGSPSPRRQRRRYTVSEKKLDANRRNAAHSSGPRTPEGKRRSALNATRHGILASHVVNRGIDGERECLRFETMLQGLILYYQPRGVPELRMVRAMAEALWRHEAVTRFEKSSAYYAWRDRVHHPHPHDSILPSQLIKDAELDLPTLPNHHNANLAIRYFAATDNAYYRAERSLERLKKSRGAPLAEGAELEAPPMPPPDHDVPLDETVARADEVIRAYQNPVKIDAFQQAFEKGLAKHGIYLTPEQRAILTPERLCPEGFGLPPNPPDELQRLLIEAGVTANLDQLESARPRRKRSAGGGKTRGTSRGAAASDAPEKVAPERADYQTNPISAPQSAPEAPAQRQDGEDPPSGG